MWQGNALHTFNDTATYLDMAADHAWLRCIGVDLRLRGLLAMPEHPAKATSLTCTNPMCSYKG